MEGDLRIALLGPPQLTLGESKPSEPLPKKGLILLYYLACSENIHERQKLAGLFWGEKGDENAFRNLRVVLTKLRKSLAPYILVGHQTLSFNHETAYWLDVQEYENLIQRAADVDGASRRALLREAVSLYQGDFLENVILDGQSIYEEWILPERERLKQSAIEALEELAELSESLGDIDASIQYGQQLLRLEPWRESAHRMLMRLYARKGRRSQALKQFDICEEALAEHFDVSPSEATFALFHHIRKSDDWQATEPLLSTPKDDRGIPFLAPSLVPHFAGRDEELLQLSEQLLELDTGQIYALVGLGGVGKTTLAIETAHLLRETFPDGVLWMNADKDDPKSTAERWANAYGYDYSRIPDLDERTAVLRELLAEKQALIICDDVTNVAKIRPLLPEIGPCAVLLTTRNADLAHRLKAQMIEVNVLTPENGRSLLINILGEDRVTAEEEAAAEICTLLEGLPLALSIAAQRLALRSRLKLGDFVVRLRQEAERIGLQDKDRAVRTSFTVSWRSLDAFQQRVFSLLAVFAGRSFSVEALAAIAEMDHYGALDKLDDLVALSLLKDEGDFRYRQHPLLADFAREKLGDPEEPFLRLVAFYQAFAGEFGQDYARLESEWENLSASINQAYRLEAWSAVLELNQSLKPAWFRRGRYYEAREAFQQAVDAAKALNNQEALARHLFDWGFICREQNDWDEAGKKLTASLKLFEALGDIARIAKVQLQLGILAIDRTDYVEAEKYLAASRQIREKLNDRLGIAETIYVQAQLQYCWGKYEDAKQLFEQSLKIQKDLDDKEGVLRTLRSLAGTLRSLGKDYTQVKAYYERAFQLADELEDQVERCVIIMNLASLNMRQGDHQKAKELALKSLEMRRKLGDRRGEAMVHYVLSEISQQQQAYHDARRYCEQSLKMSRLINDKVGIAFSQRQLGDVWVCLNQYQKGCHMWREALEIARQIQHKTLVTDLEERLIKCVK